MAGPTPAKKASSTTAAVWTVVITFVVIAACVLPAVLNRGNSDLVPAPTATERTDTVAVLERATEAQGICYGWQLAEGSHTVSVGSNLGDGTPVDDSRCLRWVQVVANVTWTPQSSEAKDYALVSIEGSSDFDLTDLFAVERGLERFGLDDEVFIDEPGWATTRAAVVLPLLLAERGLADPAPVATAAPDAAAPPLPDTANDMWRDRWGYFVAVAGLLLVTAILFTVGFVRRGKERRTAAQGVAGRGVRHDRKRP
ncbi:hypothetical protein [Micromonospora sagamiensis]|uniref:Uncharacterized protein n=1 Tax=Micromonospora sagamiensis TaxID=47875 RepID=A0A562WP71_9ACTN|nr:hypothetical protein [Micromonospora sagamiensis]TWJ31941.1 hypothetical protein JD81_05507 [Micromonospora sagamiensis]BCL15005.1 hypothetical protein GCM10017556_27440 [Micromonospora sagamiensis]